MIQAKGNDDSFVSIQSYWMIYLLAREMFAQKYKCSDEF